MCKAEGNFMNKAHFFGQRDVDVNSICCGCSKYELFRNSLYILYEKAIFFVKIHSQFGEFQNCPIMSYQVMESPQLQPDKTKQD